MADLGALRKGAAALARVALRAFALTAACMIVLGFVFAGVSYSLAAPASPLFRVLAAFVALLVWTVAGFVVAGNRAVAVSVVRGLREHRLGEGLLRLLVERMLGVPADGAMGERGGVVTRAAERVPLAQAEARLTEAVTTYLAAPAKGGGLTGGLRRKVQGKLLRVVQEVTLARFREEGAAHGGVDLLKVRDDLGRRIDGLVMARVLRTTVRSTALVLVVAAFVSVGVALALQRLAA